MKAIALDPGGTTGIASVQGEEFIVDQLSIKNHHNELWELLCELGPETVVCESFEYRNANRPGLVLDSKEYIGVAKLWTQQHDVPFVEQTASTAKNFVKDSNIKKLDLWAPGLNHAMDAMRHLLFYLINNTVMKKDLLKRGWR